MSAEPAAETDNVGDPSVEINVEELIHELEVDGVTRPGREQAAKRRLEELMEKKRCETRSRGLRRLRRLTLALMKIARTRDEPAQKLAVIDQRFRNHV